MNSIVKLSLLGVGGTALCVGSFVVFTALSGTPLYEVPVFKKLVKAPTPVDENASSSTVSSGHEMSEKTGATAETGAHPTAQVDKAAVEASVSVLGAFMLPSPFSSSELGDLQHELRTALSDAKKRQLKIKEREAQLEEWEQSLQTRSGELQEMRKLLEKSELDLRMREDEVKRDESAKVARETQSWAELAKFFSEGDPEEMARKLAQFDPKEAVKILRALDDERASQLVNALPAEKYHAYLEAYRAHPK